MKSLYSEKKPRPVATTNATQDIFVLSKIEFSDLRSILPAPRNPQAHKKSFGHVQIVAGTLQYPGAAQLCALGVFKAGCGYANIESEVAVQTIAQVPELVPGFSAAADAFVMGPGFSEDESRKAFPHFLNQIAVEKAIVLDGGALRVLSDLNVGAHKNVVATPHEGEMAALLGSAWTAERVGKERSSALDAATQLFPKFCWVLKGSETFIRTENRTYLMSFGSVAMATAGQGDVLAGVIAALLAQGLKKERAAILGTSLCALAAQNLSRNREPQGVLAHEVANEIPAVIGQIRSRPA